MDLYKLKNYPSEIMTPKSTLQGHIHRLKSPLFVDRKKQALGKEIKRLNSLVCSIHSA